MDIIHLLLENKCDVNARNQDNLTPLILASTFNKYKAVRCLLKAGAKLDSRDNSGHYPIHLASSGLTIDDPTLGVLLEYGANANSVTFSNVTPLMLACSNGVHSAVRKIAPVSNLDLMDRLYGGTALHWASSKGCHQSVHVLINHGSKLHMKDNSGRTPLIQWLKWYMIRTEWIIFITGPMAGQYMR